MNASQFVAKWQPVELTERSAYQQHFLDLCELVEHPKPAELDPKGEFFTFERGVTKRTGGRGWADVWKKNHFAIEYKGKHKNLNDAYDQLLLYRGNLENPPLLVVCDMDRIIIRTNFTGAVEKKHEIPLEGLPEPKNLDILSWLFHDPEKLRPEVTREAITVQVAQRLANIAYQMRERGLLAHAVARFLDRVVFCLFAQGVGLLPPDLFTHLIEKAGQDSKKFFTLVAQLFQAMATGGNFGLDDIRHFNGDLFDSTAVVLPTTDEMRRIKDAARLQWDQVDPSIFGTLFERGMDPDKRAQLGAHYTSREDIETVIEPVIMEPLRREWAAVQHTIESHLAGKGPKRKTKGKKPQTPSSLIVDFLQRLQSVTILDPACGSGNFLYVALQKLKDLEKEVLVFADDKGLGRFFPLVGPWQLHGIEINQYAFELAQVSIWIGYIQWHRANGYRTFHDPILRRIQTFECKDAILDLADPENPTEPDWPEVEFIVGNPPFLGTKKLRSELGDDYVEKLFEFYEERIPNFSDLCCYWFEKARAQVQSGKASRVGLLATQGIRGGLNCVVLKRIKKTGDIFFAWSNRAWVLEGANVGVSIIGFDGGRESNKSLDGKAVETINADLTSASNLTLSRRLAENQKIGFYADVKAGKFDLPFAEAKALLHNPNPHGRPNSDVLMPWANGRDVVQRPSGYWVIDFGVKMREDEASLYEGPFKVVKERVEPERRRVNRKRYRELWWLHAEPCGEMRRRIEPLERYIATTVVAKHRVFVWMPSIVLPDHALFVVTRDDDYTFGILHSKPHLLWSLRQGTFLENRPRYTPTTCFETFPFPRPTPNQREAISQAAKRLDELRSNWLNPSEMVRTEILEFPGSLEGPWRRYVRDADTRGMGIVRYSRTVARDSISAKQLNKRTLTNLYNESPAWLEHTHRKLNEAVLDAYGWDSSMTDGAILGALLALNLEREGAETTAEEADDEEPEEADRAR